MLCPFYGEIPISSFLPHPTIATLWRPWIHSRSFVTFRRAPIAEVDNKTYGDVPYTHAKGNNDGVFNQWGGNGTEISCPCWNDRSCVDPALKCNCDINDDEWHEDEGYYIQTGTGSTTIDGKLSTGLPVSNVISNKIGRHHSSPVDSYMFSLAPLPLQQNWVERFKKQLYNQRQKW